MYPNFLEHIKIIFHLEQMENLKIVGSSKLKHNIREKKNLRITLNKQPVHIVFNAFLKTKPVCIQDSSPDLALLSHKSTLT